MKEDTKVIFIGLAVALIAPTVWWVGFVDPPDFSARASGYKDVPKEHPAAASYWMRVCVNEEGDRGALGCLLATFHRLMHQIEQKNINVPGEPLKEAARWMQVCGNTDESDYDRVLACARVNAHLGEFAKLQREAESEKSNT